MEQAAKKSWIPWIFVGCMGIVVLVNAGMVTAALTTYSGLAYSDAFGRGIAYNRVLENVERQERLGWRAAIELGEANTDGVRRIVLTMRDASDTALTGAQIDVTFRRPVENMAPIAVAFDERGVGTYAGGPVLLRRGQWDAKIVVMRAGERFEVTQRLMVK